MAICSMVDVEYLFVISLNLSRTKRVDCAHSRVIDSNRSKVKRFQFSDIMSYDFRTDRVYEQRIDANDLSRCNKSENIYIS